MTRPGLLDLTKVSHTKASNVADLLARVVLVDLLFIIKKEIVLEWAAGVG